MILRADARNIPLADGCVQTCVSSPPYWGLRDYGTARWEGGAGGCDHKTGQGRQGETGQRADRTFTYEPSYRELCGKCGARRIDAQIGLEPTPEEYVATMVGVFREVWRVLRDDGTVWLNLGDSYAGGGRGYGSEFSEKQRSNKGSLVKPTAIPAGFKPKDLCGIPWRVAFALQADGWYLRSDIIWAKPNPMPESVTDRPTRSHEYIFLLSKSQRYYYDASAIMEPAEMKPQNRFTARADWPKGDDGRALHRRPEGATDPCTRNKRSVWTVNSEPTPEAHFATFPQKLIEPCILAGSRAGDLVLDPFLGSGTVGKVCERLGRRWVGLELSESYIEIAKNRTAQMGLTL